MSMPIDFDLFREVSLIHQKHADWEAITTLSIDDPSYDTYAAGFKTAVGVIEQYITNLQAANPEQAQTAVGLPKLQPHDHPEPHTHKWSRVELEAIESYATAKTAEAVRELVESLGLLVAGIENSVSPTYIPLKKANAVLAKYEPSNDEA